MELNINSWPDFVRNATILWNKGQDSVPQYARKSGLFKEMAIPQMTGNTREFTEIELEEYASRKGESNQAVRARVQQGYTKIAKLYRIAKDIGISYEWQTEGKYPEIKSKLINLGKLADNRIDLDLTHRFTFGTVVSYTDQDGVLVDTTVGDGFQLYYTLHTLRASATTFRNILANNPQFSIGALELMQAMRVVNTYNQFGQKMSIPADIIFSGDDPNTINNIAIVLRSTSNPAQNNPNVINVYNAKLKHVILPRLATDAFGANDTTKAKYWGLASSEMSTAYLGMHEEPRMKVSDKNGSAEEFSTDDINFGTRAGYMICAVSASWTSLSKGDGTV